MLQLLNVTESHMDIRIMLDPRISSGGKPLLASSGGWAQLASVAGLPIRANIMVNTDPTALDEDVLSAADPAKGGGKSLHKGHPITDDHWTENFAEAFADWLAGGEPATKPAAQPAAQTGPATESATLPKRTARKASRKATKGGAA